MRSVLKYIILLGALAGAIFIINDQRKKLAAIQSDPNIKKPRAYSIEELQHRRNRIIENMNEIK